MRIMPPAKKIDMIVSELAKYGVVSIRKAYGNWKKPSIKGWEDVLHEYSIQPVQQFDIVKGKNATDMAMTIDIMDILYTKNIDAFCIVSSDCDFTPLVLRVLSEGNRSSDSASVRPRPHLSMRALGFCTWMRPLNRNQTESRG